MVAHLQWQTTIKIRYQGDRSISSCQHTHAISFAWNFRQSGDIFGKRVFQGEVYLWCSLDRDSGGSCAGASIPTGLSSHTQIRDWFWWWIPKLRVSKTKLGTVAHSTNQNVYALLQWWKSIHYLKLISLWYKMYFFLGFMYFNETRNYEYSLIYPFNWFTY